ncbi:hypothetical protein CTI14_41115, partial [Methylobacterium radiotolerans]
IAVRGVFDEAQDIVKALAGDLAFKTKYRLGAVKFRYELGPVSRPGRLLLPWLAARHRAHGTHGLGR